MIFEKMIPFYENKNQPIVGVNDVILPNTYFNLIKLPVNDETNITVEWI